MARHGIVVGLLLCSTMSSAGPAPKKMPKAGSDAELKTLLLFPAPSEIATALKVGGVQVKPIPQLEAQIPTPAWSKLSPLQKELQLGSIAGYMAVAVMGGDMPAVTRSLDQLVAGAASFGVDKNAAPFKALSQMRDKAKAGKISDAQLLAGLDQARRDVFREISGKVQEKEFGFVLAAAWLRGGSLLAGQVKSDAEASKLGEFVLRPELLQFIKQIPDTGKGADAAARTASADRLLALAKNSSRSGAHEAKPAAIQQKDLAEFVSYANAVLR